MCIRDSFIAVHHDLMAVSFFRRVKLIRLEQIFQRVIVTAVETGQGICNHCRVFAAEAFLNELGQFRDRCV